MASKADEKKLDETARIARDLIRFDTTNYGDGKSNGEADAAEYVAGKLTDLGLEPQLFESEPGRVSVVARIEGRGDGTSAETEKSRVTALMLASRGEIASPCMLVGMPPML